MFEHMAPHALRARGGCNNTCVLLILKAMPVPLRKGGNSSHNAAAAASTLTFYVAKASAK